MQWKEACRNSSPKCSPNPQMNILSTPRQRHTDFAVTSKGELPNCVLDPPIVSCRNHKSSVAALDGAAVRHHTPNQCPRQRYRPVLPASSHRSINNSYHDSFSIRNGNLESTTPGVNGGFFYEAADACSSPEEEAKSREQLAQGLPGTHTYEKPPSRDIKDGSYTDRFATTALGQMPHVATSGFRSK